MHNLKRNFVIWSVVTIICAAPSFIIAGSDKHNIAAMLLGILVVILFYTFAASSNFYKEVKENNHILNRSLKITFIFKIILAILGGIVSIIGIGAFPISMFLIMPDFYCGIIAIMGVRKILNLSNVQVHEFFPTLSITLVEAVLMSLAILITALLICAVQKIYIAIFRRSNDA